MLTVVDMQKFFQINKADPENEISCLEQTMYNRSGKICVNFNRETYSLNFFEYRYRKDTCQE